MFRHYDKGDIRYTQICTQITNYTHARARARTYTHIAKNNMPQQTCKHQFKFLTIQQRSFGTIQKWSAGRTNIIIFRYDKFVKWWRIKSQRQFSKLWYLIKREVILTVIRVHHWLQSGLSRIGSFTVQNRFVTIMTYDYTRRWKYCCNDNLNNCNDNLYTCRWMENVIQVIYNFLPLF